MPRRGTHARRSAAEWAFRGLLAVIAAALGYIGATHAFAYAIRGGDVERAHALAPGDGRVASLLARKLSGPDATAADRVRADRLARAALRRDPTAVAAVATLGANAQLRGDASAARRLFAYSQALSRRDLLTRLWAVEDAVARGDVAAALRHYDVALRTSRTAPALLFPVLGAAIADPAIRAALAGTLAARPVWGGTFVNYVAGNGPDVRATAALFLQLRRNGVPVSGEASAVAIGGLILADRWNDAWSYYRVVRPGADRRASRDPDFTANLATPSPFDWTPLNDEGVTTSVQRGERGGVFDFTAPAGIGGPLLHQAQLLPPGDYRVDGRSADLDQAAGARPYWTLTCRDGRELGRVVVPNSAEAGGIFTGRFRVPAGCPVQTLALIARPSDAVEGLAGRIEQVRLGPAS